MIELEAAADSTWQGYSLAERDRRWKAVRDNAAAAGFDAIFVPQTIDPRGQLSPETARGAGSDARYLTQLENTVVIVPTDGRPAVAVNDRGAGNAWLQARSGTARGGRGSWAPVIVDAFRELGLERGRIGVSGLKGGKVTHARSTDGVVSHTPYAEVVRALPNATFEDATDVAGYARYRKGEEEIACLRRGAAIVELGIEEMEKVARPGVDEAVLYGRVVTRIMEMGSEYYPLALVTGQLGEDLIRFTEPPTGRRLQPMQLLTNEVDAVWGGMIAQEDQPMLLGKMPDEWRRLVDFHRELFEAGLEFLKPGVSFGELIDFTNAFGEKRGFKSLILMHGRGYGNDGPLLTPRARGEAIRSVIVENNSTWVWKPIAMSPTDEHIEFSWGGCVMVTDKGGERLSRRPHGMRELV